MRVEVHAGEFQVADGVYDEGYALTVILGKAEAQQLLTEYLPDTGTTPSITTCRPLVRAMCASLKEKTDAAT